MAACKLGALPFHLYVPTLLLLPGRTLLPCFVQQAVAYASYVTTNHWLYNFTRIATLLVGGASALSGAARAGFFLYRKRVGEF